MMNENTIKILVDAGALDEVRVIANGGIFYVEAITKKGRFKAVTNKGALKTWKTIDAAAKWAWKIGIGSAYLVLEGWQPNQRSL